MKEETLHYVTKVFAKERGFISLIIPALLLLGIFSSAGVEAATYRASVSLASVDGVACPSNAAGPCPDGTTGLVLAAGREHTVEVFFGWDFVDPGGETEVLDNLVNTIEIVAVPAEFVSAGEEVDTALTTINAARAALTPPLAAIFAAGIFAPPQFSVFIEGIFSYADPGPSQGIPFVSAATGSSYPQLARVTYTFPDTASGIMMIQNSHDLASGVDFYGDPPVTQTQILTVNIARPQFLARLAVNSGSDGGILDITSVIPTSTATTSIADADLVSADGVTTCLGGAEPSCMADTGHSSSIVTVTFALPGTAMMAVECTGVTTATQTCQAIEPTAVAEGLPVDLTSGAASLTVSGVQYDLLGSLALGNAVLLGSATSVTINGITVPLQATIGADQTDPTVPAGFAGSFMCTAGAFTVTCMWADGAADDGSGLADFEVNLYQGADCSDSVTSGAADFTGTVSDTAITLGTPDDPASGSYCATLTVMDNGENEAEGSPFTTTVMTVAFSRTADSDGNGVPDSLDAFGTYADLDAAVTAIGIDSDGQDGPDSVSFSYGLLEAADVSGAAPSELICAPAYGLAGDGMADLTACMDDGGEAIGNRIVHVANGVVYGPTDAPSLGGGMLSSGRYLLSHRAGGTTGTVTLTILTVLPQLVIEYPTESDGQTFVDVNEDPMDNPSSPTVFTVMAIGDAIPVGPISVTVTAASLPADTAVAVAVVPSTVSVVSSTETFVSTPTALAVHTGIPAGGFVRVGMFTIEDEQLADLDAISFTFTGVTGASTALQTVTDPNGDLVCGPPDPDSGSRGRCSMVVLGGDPVIEVTIAQSGGGGGVLGWLSLAVLAMLGVLSGLIRRRGFAVAAALLLAVSLLPAVSSAQPSTISDPSQWRIGLDIGQGLIEPEFDGEDEATAKVDEDTDFGYRLSLEHATFFNENAGLELFWADLGEAEVSESGQGTSGTIESWVLGLGAVWHWRDVKMLGDWSPYASFGYRYVDTDFSGAIFDFETVNGDADSDSGVYWNIGAEGGLTDNLIARVFYEAYDEDLGFWGVGLVWHPGETAAPARKHRKARKARKDRAKASQARGRAEARSSRAARRSETTHPRRAAAAAQSESCRKAVPKGMTPMGWYVQAVTYTSADRARSTRKQLMDDGYRKVGVASRGSLHAVRIATETCAQAQRVKRELRRKLGVNGFVRPYASHAF